MSKQHAFAQCLITKGARTEVQANYKWSSFRGICDELGFNVRVTGGNFLTHEIDGSNDDFEAILELLNN